MAGSRTLKLSILADVDDLKKKLDSGANEVEGFGGKLEKFGKVAGAAFAAAAAAAAAYAGKLAIEGVKAAIEDEAAQQRLANALKNVTDVTDDQIKSIEEQILKTSLATGVADDKLRPALQRLTIATKDVTQSQDLLKLALDVSAATGRDVESVSNALAKAYEGNNGALTRLGIGISATEAKTLGFQGTVKQLSETFGGAAATQANTFEGQINRLKVSFDEAKESVGAALLPALKNLLDYFINTVIPKFIEFKDRALAPVTAAIENNKESLTNLYKFVKDFIIPIFINGLGDALEFIGKVIGVTLTVIAKVTDAVKGAIELAISGINTLIGIYNNTIGRLPGVPDIPKITTPTFGSTSGGTGGGSTTPKITVVPKPSISISGAGSGVGGTPGANILSNPSVTTTIIPSGNALNAGVDLGRVRLGEQRGDVIINVNSPSIIDRESFSRAVVEALNESADRGTGGGGGLYSL